MSENDPESAPPDSALELDDWADVRTLWSRAGRDRADDAAGRWALSVLERELGRKWVGTCRKHGWLPPELLTSGSHLLSFALLIDLACALFALREVPNVAQVRRTLKKHPVPEELVSARCALRLAAAATAGGLRAGVEIGKPPVDLVLEQDSGEPILAEIKSLLQPEVLADIDRWYRDLQPRLFSLLHDGALRLEGEAVHPLDPPDTDVVVDRILDAARLVRSGLTAPPVQAGRNVFHVTAATDSARSGLHVARPGHDLGHRLEQRLHRALAQTEATGVGWVVLDFHDDLWELTDWGQATLEEQARALAGFIRSAHLADAGGASSRLDGVIVTDGGRLLDFTTTDETVNPEPGVLGLRRRVDRGRTRAMIAVTTSVRGTTQLPAWRCLFDAEPQWVRGVLREAGVVSPPSLFPPAT